MAQKAIIHTATRVIRRLTTDDDHTLGLDESAVILNDPVDIGGGYWKLDEANKKVPATDKEIDDAGVDEEKEKAKFEAKRDELKTIIFDIADKGATLEKVRAYFQIIKSSYE